MKKIKKNYTNFVLTVIAVALIGILFKGEIIKPAHAIQQHYHYTDEISNFKQSVKKVVQQCKVEDIAAKSIKEYKPYFQILVLRC